MYVCMYIHTCKMVRCKAGPLGPVAGLYIHTYDWRGKMGNFREPVFTCLPAAIQESNVAGN